MQSPDAWEVERPAELLALICSVLEDTGIRYAVGGSLAAMVYGEPRMTQDIDIVAALDDQGLSALVERLPPSVLYLDLPTARQAVREAGQFNIVHPWSGMKIDLYVAGDDLSRAQVRGARQERLDDATEAMFSPPEELIVQKLQFYASGGSDKHLRDVSSMLRIAGDRIDRTRAGELAVELGLGHVWEAVLKRVDDR